MVSFHAKLFESLVHLAAVVRKLDNPIHQINHYPVDSVVCFVNTYPLDSDYPAFEQPGPGLRFTFKGKLGDLPLQWQFSVALIVSLNSSITPFRQFEGILTLASDIKINSARKAENTIHF